MRDGLGLVHLELAVRNPRTEAARAKGYRFAAHARLTKPVRPDEFPSGGGVGNPLFTFADPTHLGIWLAERTGDSGENWGFYGSHYRNAHLWDVE